MVSRNMRYDNTILNKKRDRKQKTLLWLSKHIRTDEAGATTIFRTATNEIIEGAQTGH
jgi:hypothetical protein